MSFSKIFKVFLRRDLLRPKDYWDQTKTGQIWLGCCGAEGL
nr:MAG TPA: hypothetical protein [Caudoviricetes sp.]